MDPTRPPRQTAPRRSALTALVALAAAALVTLSGVAVGARGADAAPRLCDDASLASCEGSEPAPTTRPVRPAPPTTTPGSPTTLPPVTPTTWSTLVRTLDQAEGDLGTLTADRTWLQMPVFEPAGVWGGPLDLWSMWTPVPAGTAALQGGEAFTFDARELPVGAHMVLRVNEAGSPGPACRTQPMSAIPPDATELRILAAPPMTIPAAQLDGLVDDLVGPVTGLDPGVTATIASASLTTTDDGVVLDLEGSLTVVYAGVELAFDFRAEQLITLAPATTHDLRSTLVVSAPQPAVVTLDHTGPPLGAPSEAAAEAAIAPVVGTQMRAAVQRRAPGLVNQSIASMHAVRWWTSQRFGVSIRRVTTSPAGVTVHPSVCRLG